MHLNNNKPEYCTYSKEKQLRATRVQSGDWNCKQRDNLPNMRQAASEDLPPETGASMKTAPIVSAALANSFETAGSIVLESISNEPFFTFLK